ncbi:MAG: NAD(P)-dependent oxidoreductase [Erysipelotrichaceae bacterium]|nr:NAD(P)-dependent oxidoreductase [Erysipelotrichaceae bacterium]
MKVAIVTGANGFIGKAMTEFLLKEKFFVYAIVTDENSLADIKCSNLKVIKAFFDDYKNLAEQIDKKPDVFFHFAWQGVFGKSFSDYALQYSNVVNTGISFELAIKLGVQKFVLASTVNVLEAKDAIIHNRGIRYRNTMNYAMAKLSSEMLCKTLASNSTVLFNTVYLSMAYGPNNRALTVQNVVMSKIAQGISPDLIKGDGLYDLIYIDDVVRGFYQVYLYGEKNESYYIGHQNLKTFKELFVDIGNVIDKKVKLNFGVYPEENSINYSLIDIKKTKDVCKFEPTSNFEESVKITIKWLKDNDYLGVK